MNKLCVLVCLLISLPGIAQTAPKVVFVGENLTAAWQSSSEFTANKNWVGEGITVGDTFSGAGEVLQNFQASVINQHPAFVHIMTGFSDSTTVKDSTPLGVVFEAWQSDIIQMVDMANKANIKVILGNLIALSPATTTDNPEAISFMNAWLDAYGRANNIPVVNYNAAFCQCAGAFSNYTYLFLPNLFAADGQTPTDAGNALLTQMAQTAIATYGLTVKSGYLSNLLLEDMNQGRPETPQVNNVEVGSALIFTPQAKWSDGVVRPMLNENYDGMQGVWTSSNPAVMYVSQRGQAMAYGIGKTTISFKSASGVPFSPWVMTVVDDPLQY